MNFADLFRVTLPETALEVAALLVMVVDLGVLRRASRELRLSVAALLGVLGCGVALSTIPMQSAGGLYAGNELLLATGGSATAAQVAILALTVLTLLLLIDTKFTRHAGEFVAVTLMAATGGLLIAAAQDLLVIFVGLELLSLGLYILTAFAKQSAKSAEAAMKYYLFGGMSAAFLLFGFSYLSGITGSTNLAAIAAALQTPVAAQAGPLLLVSVVAIAAGLGFKVAAAPFHMWAPDAYEGAPAPGAAFIASVSKVASFSLLISIAAAVWPTAGTGGAGLGLFLPAWTEVLLILSATSMLLGNLAALAQTSVRRLLAYSAIAHAGYILLALAFFSSAAHSAQAILYYVITYGLTTIGAFAAVGVVERAMGSDKLDAFAGLHRKSPLLAAVLLVLFLSLAGIPPLVGFWSKFNLFAAVLAVAPGALGIGMVVLAIGMSAVSLYYYLQVLKRVYVVPALDGAGVPMHPVTIAVLLFITAGVVLLGCLPALLGDWLSSFYAML